MRLENLGDWLAINGEAIFNTRPWIRADGKTSQGLDVRFTKKDNSLYATLLGIPTERSTIIEDLEIPPMSRIQLLGQYEDLEWTHHGSDLQIELPENLPDFPAHCIKIFGLG